jgi:hypothetical protein
MEKQGIVELKDLVSFFVKIINSSAAALKDGKTTLGDASLFMPVVVALPKALMGIEMVPAEAKDLDSAEIKELIETVKAEIDLPAEKAEMLIKGSLDVALRVYDLVLSAKA